MAAASVPKLYRSVIEDVINSVREAFLDEGIDEQVLIELRQTWEKKLVESKAVDPKEPDHVLNTRQVTLQQPAQIQQQQQQQPSQQHQQATAAASTGATTGQIASSGIAHHLTLQPGSLVQQAVLQYTAAEGVDGQKTVTVTMPQKMTITLPAQLTQGGFQTMMSGPATAATLALPPEITASLLQQATLNQGGVLNVSRAQTTPIHTTSEQRPGMQYQTVSAEQLAKQPQYTVTVAQAPANAHPQAVSQAGGIIQLDGHCDTSDEEEEDDDFQDNDDDRDDDNEDQNDDENEYTGEDEEPLNSEDDVSDADPSELFDTDNVVVCQYDKITRSRNKWKFHLKDGIMNLQGKDYVFQKAVGDAEW